MKAVVILLAAAAALPGCSREPRSAAYFEAHVEEAIRVVARCRNGDNRGAECANAEAALAAADRKVRMGRYQQNF